MDMDRNGATHAYESASAEVVNSSEMRITT
jgi:hypothetical protein